MQWWVTFVSHCRSVVWFQLWFPQIILPWEIVNFCQANIYCLRRKNLVEATLICVLHKVTVFASYDHFSQHEQGADIIWMELLALTQGKVGYSWIGRFEHIQKSWLPGMWHFVWRLPGRSTMWASLRIKFQWSHRFYPALPIRRSYGD